MRNKALGRGLSSLLKEEIIPIETNQPKNILNINEIEVGEFQPRKHFDSEKIKELANSIVSNGLVQPIIVNKTQAGKYKIIAGERRYRACKIAGLDEIPVVIKELTDKEVLEIALIENIQREELTSIEEAEGFERLMKEFNYTQAELAIAVGKSRSHVANLLRLNQLPNSIKIMLNEGKLSMGHARCLIGLDNAEILAKNIIDNDLNVRQAEELTKKKDAKVRVASKSKNNPNKEMDEDLLLVERALSEKFSIKVVVENSANGGKISFHYNNFEELDSILTRLN